MNSGLNVFLLIGQSNMAGRGDMTQVPPLDHPNVFMFRGDQWLPAKEPLHTDKPTRAGVGLAMSFAVELARTYPGAKIGLVSCAVGGTPLSRWMPGADLYMQAVATAKKALPGNVLQGFLWHQGEGDSHKDENSATYGTRLTEMIRTLRSELGGERVPFISGELGEFLKNHPTATGREIVNGHLNDLKTKVPLYGCASSAGLEDKGDNTHFSSPALREFGLRYAAEYLRVVKSGSLPPLR